MGGYLVTERADAFLVGLLMYAMTEGHDIICEQPVTSELLVMLKTQLIPTVVKHDDRFHHVKIYCETEDEPIPNEGAVGTGNSLGTDSFCTIAQYYNSPSKNLKLTHLLTSSKGVVGGYYQKNNWDYCAQKLYEKEKNVADELGLPLIHVNTNLMKIYTLRTDWYLDYWLIMLVMSLGKLFGTYFISSNGADFSYFNVNKTYKEDCTTYSLLTFCCCSINGGTKFLSGGGELDRSEKLEIISKFKIGRENLQSCLTEHYNCMTCQKCKRNLLCMDAMGLLDKYTATYDIPFYLKHRDEYIRYLCDMVNGENGLHGDFLRKPYDLIKAREPELIQKFEISLNEKISQRNEMERQRNVYSNYTSLFRKALSTENYELKLKSWFEKSNIKNVIIYGNGGNSGAQFIISISKRFGFKVSYIVEDIRPGQKISIPRLPESTVNYPECDAVIICNVDKPEIIQKKLSYFVNVPIYTFSDVIEMKLL